MTDRHERVESGLEQTSIVRTRQPRLTPAGVRLGNALFYPDRKLPAVRVVMKKAVSVVQ